MLKKIALGMALLSLAASWVQGAGPEPPAGKWWRMPVVEEQLNLSPGMQDRLDELFQRNRHTLIRLKSDLERERLELDFLLDKRKIEEGAVASQYQRLDEVRSTLAREQFEYLLEVRKILGYERYQQLKQLFHEKRSLRTSEDY
ncbi:MAG: Spy/CpxP family protein refolding chaperone [Desulfohalobiaceae bacterium]